MIVLVQYNFTTTVQYLTVHSEIWNINIIPDSAERFDILITSLPHYPVCWKADYGSNTWIVIFSVSMVLLDWCKNI